MSESIKYGTLNGFPRLFQDYVQNFKNVKDLFSGNPEVKASWTAQFKSLESCSYHREELARILETHNGKFGNIKLYKSLIEKLKDPGCTAVITGQQAGLFLGPLYTIYKAVTAVKLAQKLEEEWDRPVVPLFWLEVDDHDFDEVRQFYLLSPKGDLKKFMYTDEDPDSLVSVGKRYLSVSIRTLFEDISSVFEFSENAAGMIRSMQNTYAPGQSLADVFIRFFRFCMPDLPILIVNSGDTGLKRLARPFFERVILEKKKIEAALVRRTKRVSNKAYEIQAAIRPGDIHLFQNIENGRVRLDYSSVFDSSSLTEKQKVIKAQDFVERYAENLSADVLLRPLLQDYLFPTVSYVAGPGELSYLAQLKELYGFLEIPMPVMYPRWSGTIVDEKTKKFLESAHIKTSEFFETDDAELEQMLIEQSSGKQYDSLFTGISSDLASGLDELRSNAAELDKSLINMIDQSEKKMLYHIEKIQNRFTGALKAKNKVVVDRSRRARNLLLPFGRPQERVFPVIEFMLRYGQAFPEFLMKNVTTDTGRHHIVEYTV